VAGKLLRNGRDDESGQEVGAILFEDLSDYDRERIARYIFNCERKSKMQQTADGND
jgi:c-di-GMP-binding flagellar brake protein YcgR